MFGMQNYLCPIVCARVAFLFSVFTTLHRFSADIVACGRCVSAFCWPSIASRCRHPLLRIFSSFSRSFVRPSVRLSSFLRLPPVTPPHPDAPPRSGAMGRCGNVLDAPAPMPPVHQLVLPIVSVGHSKSPPCALDKCNTPGKPVTAGLVDCWGCLHL